MLVKGATGDYLVLEYFQELRKAINHNPIAVTWKENWQHSPVSPWPRDS